jgi:class 3 adenylate cyclase
MMAACVEARGLAALSELSGSHDHIAVDAESAAAEDRAALLERRIEAVLKFPDQNPNPVFRVTPHGRLLYANAASGPILRPMQAQLGDDLPAEIANAIGRHIRGVSSETIEVAGEGGRIYALEPVLIPEFDFVNVYGTDITARLAVDRFPGENPNPVFRISLEGTLTYANGASGPILEALGAGVGRRLDPAVWDRIAAAAPGSSTIEVEAGDRLFALRVVSLDEFASINVYGTDITAAREVERANAENERLLLNILPQSIADRLRSGEAVIADRFDEMAVLFADVVAFTPFSSTLTPEEVVVVLNGVFSLFDQLAEQRGLEKIKTIGDAYLVVGGLDGAADGPERVAWMGLEMIDALDLYRTDSGRKLEIRVGMHVGPVIGGVIGLKKFIYDVWGDTVNTASRMESHGVPGRVHVTEAAYLRLRDTFDFEPRGSVEVKGKGSMATYLVVGPRRPSR